MKSNIKCPTFRQVVGANLRKILYCSDKVSLNELSINRFGELVEDLVKGKYFDKATMNFQEIEYCPGPFVDGNGNLTSSFVSSKYEDSEGTEVEKVEEYFNRFKSAQILQERLPFTCKEYDVNTKITLETHLKDEMARLNIRASQIVLTNSINWWSERRKYLKEKRNLELDTGAFCIPFELLLS